MSSLLSQTGVLSGSCLAVGTKGTATGGEINRASRNQSSPRSLSLSLDHRLHIVSLLSYSLVIFSTTPETTPKSYHINFNFNILLLVTRALSSVKAPLLIQSVAVHVCPALRERERSLS